MLLLKNDICQKQSGYSSLEILWLKSCAEVQPSSTLGLSEPPYEKQGWWGPLYSARKRAGRVLNRHQTQGSLPRCLQLHPFCSCLEVDCSQDPNI